MAFTYWLKWWLSPTYSCLYRSNWTLFASFIHWIYCLFLPDERREMEQYWNYTWGKLSLKINILRQREIYLQEQISTLGATPSSKSLIDWETTEGEESNTTTTVNEYKHELLNINQRLFLLCQYRYLMFIERPNSPIVSELLLCVENGRWWDMRQMSCILSGGCCARDCGCCERPRQPKTDQNRPAVMDRSHCTIACGCCIRYRGFGSLSKEYLKLARVTIRRFWEFEWMVDPRGL